MSPTSHQKFIRAADFFLFALVIGVSGVTYWQVQNWSHDVEPLATVTSAPACPAVNNNYAATAPVFDQSQATNAFPTCDSVYTSLTSQMDAWPFDWTQTPANRALWIKRLMKPARISLSQYKKFVTVYSATNKTQKVTTYPLEQIREQLRTSITTNTSLTQSVITSFNPTYVNALTFPAGAVACRITTESAKTCATGASSSSVSSSSSIRSSSSSSTVSSLSGCTSIGPLSADIKVRNVPYTGKGTNGMTYTYDSAVYDISIKNAGSCPTPAGKMDITLTMSGLNAAGVQNSHQLTQIARSQVTTSTCTIVRGVWRNDGGQDTTLSCPVASLAVGSSQTFVTTADSVPGPTCFNLEVQAKLMAVQSPSPQPYVAAIASWNGAWPSLGCTNEKLCGKSCP